MAASTRRRCRLVAVLLLLLLLCSTVSVSAAATPALKQRWRIPPLSLDAASILEGRAAASSSRQASGASSLPPPLPDLLLRQMNATERQRWTAVGQMLWDALTLFDLDFVDAANNTVPPSPNATIASPRACGRIARVWVRMPFHDCGTFTARTRTGGCNGSLRRELFATEPLLNRTTGEVIFDDVFEELGTNKSRADVEFDPARAENQGFAVSTSFFYQVKFAAEGSGLEASWADISTYAAMLSVAICQGPLILFVPGRVDSEEADPSGLLPAPTESLQAILRFYTRTGLGMLNGIAVQASHSVACFAAGCLDDTPNQLDNRWAQELLEWNLQDLSELCTFPAAVPTSKAQCYAPFDAMFLTRPATRRILQLLASNVASADQLARAAAVAAGPAAPGATGQSGLLWGVNLCTPDACDPAQFAFFHLYATAFYRLTSLGLPQDWPGFSPELTGATPDTKPATVVTATAGRARTPAGAGTAGARQAAATGSSTAGAEKTEAERQGTEQAWQSAYDFSRGQCSSR